MQNYSADKLKSYIDRIERLEQEKKNISEDIREIFSQAKGDGFNTKIIREIIKIRKKDDSELQEEEYLLDTYRRALGMLPEVEG